VQRDLERQMNQRRRVEGPIDLIANQLRMLEDKSHAANLLESSLHLVDERRPATAERGYL
jgi:hypothetical protein